MRVVRRTRHPERFKDIFSDPLDVWNPGENGDHLSENGIVLVKVLKFFSKLP